MFVYFCMQEGERDCVVKKFCPSHLVSTDSKANVTCAVFNWNGSGQFLMISQF